ncbi:uncharacterized protein B0T23DRAFT_402372 [Neurospora hispaniola]|uniref:Rhodanese domain-containing protein n=1 Tax=Neurospora hispaniola TaxID=588809 RepID=A0AAJ0MU40_9PEZI|nr:hypothetical protein B0T23DRAFT_402372 [Neurospora hispaniola]
MLMVTKLPGSDETRQIGKATSGCDIPSKASEDAIVRGKREDGTPWWAAFPEPTSTPVHIEPQTVLELLEQQEHVDDMPQSRRLLLVDCRRTDCAGGTVSSSINLPAHNFFPTRKSLYALCKQAGIQKVVFYCGTVQSILCSLNSYLYRRPSLTPMLLPPGSSAGRGPRCAAWMQDYINDVGGDLQSQVMTGGIRGWVRMYGDRMVDGYDEKTWKQLLSEKSCT